MALGKKHVRKIYVSCFYRLLTMVLMSTGLLTLLSLPAHSFLVPTDHVWFVKCRQKTGVP